MFCLTINELKLDLNAPLSCVLKRYRSKSIVLKKWKLLEITKSCPKPCSTIPHIRKNWINLFDFAPLDTLRCEILWLQKKKLGKISCSKNLPICKISFNNWTSRCLFFKKFSEVFRVWCHENPKRKVANRNGVKRIKSIFADKGNSETRFEAPLCHFK